MLASYNVTSLETKKAVLELIIALKKSVTFDKCQFTTLPHIRSELLTQVILENDTFKRTFQTYEQIISCVMWSKYRLRYSRISNNRRDSAQIAREKQYTVSWPLFEGWILNFSWK